MYDELAKCLREATGWENASAHYSLMKQAADAIEELSKPRWIPVTERLPEKYTDVLIYYERNAWPDGADYPVRKREIGIGFCGGPDRWHVDHCGGVDGLAWMPIPKPPKEEA